jgi:hypothetical protein
MASGKLGGVNLTAATNTTLYTVPASTTASFSVNFANRNTTSVAVRLAIGSSATPAATDWVFYDVIIPGNGELERTGLVLGAADLVVVYSSAANVTATAYGYEE